MDNIKQNIAEETDMAFYTQSDLTNLYRTPEVMVVGINPGSEGTYKGQKENPNWGLDGKDMTGEQLLKGNYCKEDNGKTSWENRTKWGYWSRLKNYFANINNGNLLNKDVFCLHIDQSVRYWWEKLCKKKLKIFTKSWNLLQK